MDTSITIGQIILFAGATVPANFVACDGALLQIEKYIALYALIGTRYGGDPRTTFGVPKLTPPAGMMYLLCAQGNYPTNPTGAHHAVSHSAPHPEAAAKLAAQPLAVSYNYLTIGQVILFGGSFAPAGFHLCDGTVLPIYQDSALFKILGNRFGGDGQNTFALPRLEAPANMNYLLADPPSGPIILDVYIFVGAAILFAGGFTPQGYLPCNGALLDVGPYQVLCSILLDNFGGQFPNTFGLPNLPAVSAIPWYIAYQGIYPTQP